MDIQKDIKAVVFDLDGTIFHLEVDWLQVQEAVRAKLGKPDMKFEELLPALNDPNNHEAAKILEEAEIQGVTTGYETTNAGQALKKIQKNYKLAVVSRNSKHAIKDALQFFNLDVPFVGREDVENLKPHPEGLEWALNKLNVSSQNAIMVGDTYHDVEAAHNVAMPCVVVTNPKHEYTPDGADYYIDSIDQLPDLLQKINRDKE